MVSLLLLNLLGCASPFEGTWLFLADRQTKESGDCADPDDETRLTGTSNAWVDIYKLQSGEFTVLLSEALVGTAEGSELQASWEQAMIDGDDEERQSIEFEATIDGNTMAGTVTAESSTTAGDGYVCTVETDFTAERTVSSPDSYPEN